MVDAYVGTTDWEDGDDVDVAESEIRATLAGDYGEFNSVASAVILGESGEPVSALFASKLIRYATYQMHRSGIEDIYLFVSDANPARLLYEKVGFSET